MTPASWRTTLAGLAAALGTAAQAVDDPRLRTVGLIVSVLAFIALGVFARDAAAPVFVPPQVPAKADPPEPDKP